MGSDPEEPAPASDGSKRSRDGDAHGRSPIHGTPDETVLRVRGRGQQIAGFVLQERIDRDSNNQFGEVWLAHRLEPFQRVAIKFLRRDRVSEEMVQRFSRAESKALAMFNHPYIARFYELGFCGDTPYLVMQYVPGDTLTAYADRHRLSISERLMLMAKVCDAVQHVHLTGIVHRDLKPANILVSESRPWSDAAGPPDDLPQRDAETGSDKGPIPVLIDFGLAKSVNPDAPLTSKFVSRLGGMAGTPAYASPEQISARRPEDTGRQADIYALGAVLFELLAGVSPMAHVLSDTTLSDPERMARLAKDARPSMADAFGRLPRAQQDSIATARGVSAEALTRLLRSRLGHLTDRALRQAPTARFSDARAFARDIANYLAHRDFVEAASEPRLDRLRRWVSRNRIEAGASAAVLAALVGGAALATWQWRAAVRERDLAQSSLQFLQAFLGPVQEDRGDGAATALGDLLVNARSEVSTRLAGKPSAAANVLAVLAESAISLGEFESAHGLAGDGLVQLTMAPDDLLQSRLEDVQTEAQFRMRLSDDPGSIEVLKTRLDEIAEQHGEESDVAIRSRMQYANTLKWAGRLDDARTEYDTVLRHSRNVYGEDSIESLRARHNRNTVMVRRARDALKAKDSGGAQRIFAEALDERTSICADAARVLPKDHWFSLWCEAELLGVLAESGKELEAVERYPALLQRQRQVLGHLHWRTAETQARYGKALSKAGMKPAAALELMEALSVYRTSRPDHSDTTLITDFLVTQLVECGWIDDARHVLMQSCAEAAAAAARKPDSADLQRLAKDRQSRVADFCDTYGEPSQPGPWPPDCTCVAPDGR